MNAGDDAKLLDELGDVLFQVYFLSLLLEERGAGDLAAVASRCAEKLVRRHPHVFGDAEASTADAVLRRWDAIKRTEPGASEDPFGDLPESLPATIYAGKVQRRAAGAGLVEGPEPLRRLEEEIGRLRLETSSGERAFEAIGELLYAAVAAAREAGVDAELALRAAALRRRDAATPPRTDPRPRPAAATRRAWAGDPASRPDPAQWTADE